MFLMMDLRMAMMSLSVTPIVLTLLLTKLVVCLARILAQSWTLSILEVARKEAGTMAMEVQEGMMKRDNRKICFSWRSLLWQCISCN